MPFQNKIIDKHQMSNKYLYSIYIIYNSQCFCLFVHTEYSSTEQRQISYKYLSYLRVGFSKVLKKSIHVERYYQ